MAKTRKRPAAASSVAPRRRPAASAAQASSTAEQDVALDTEALEGGEEFLLQETGAFPEPNDWRALLPETLPALPRPLRVALPCCGVDACGVALKCLEVDHVCCNVYDLEHRYAPHLEQNVRLAEGSSLHLGPTAGDLTRCDLKDVERPVDVVVSGPPCPPWAGMGNRRGPLDVRSQVFIHVLQWVVALVKIGDLACACLENVKGIAQKDGSEEGSFMAKLLQVLRKEASEFAWAVHTLHARNYRLAQQRTRVFLRGVRLSYSSVVPDPLTPFGELPLRAFLNPELPSVDRAALTVSRLFLWT